MGPGVLPVSAAVEQLQRAEKIRDAATAELSAWEVVGSSTDQASWSSTWAQLKSAVDRAEAGVAVAKRQAADEQEAAKRRALIEKEHVAELSELADRLKASQLAAIDAVRAAREALLNLVNVARQHVALIGEAAATVRGFGLDTAGRDLHIGGANYVNTDISGELLLLLAEQVKARGGPVRPSLWAAPVWDAAQQRQAGERGGK